MRVNRKTIEAELKQVKQQLEVHRQPTRKALNAYVRATKDANEDLTKKLKAAVDKIAELTAPKEEVSA